MLVSWAWPLPSLWIKITEPIPGCRRHLRTDVEGCRALDLRWLSAGDMLGIKVRRILSVCLLQKSHDKNVLKTCCFKDVLNHDRFNPLNANIKDLQTRLSQGQHAKLPTSHSRYNVSQETEYWQGDKILTGDSLAFSWLILQRSKYLDFANHHHFVTQSKLLISSSLFARMRHRTFIVGTLSSSSLCYLSLDSVAGSCCSKCNPQNGVRTHRVCFGTYPNLFIPQSAHPYIFSRIYAGIKLLLIRECPFNRNRIS